MCDGFILLVEKTLLLNTSDDDVKLKNKYVKFITFVLSEEEKFINRQAYFHALIYTRAELFSLHKRSKNNVVAYLEKAIEIIDQKIELTKSLLMCSSDRQNESTCKLKWTGSIAEFVEIIYSLYFVKRISNGKVTLKELFRQMGLLFEIEVKEFANYYMNIKMRKDGGRTKFIDLMKKNLTEKMEGTDRKPFRK